jgi:hypothetical protein
MREERESDRIRAKLQLDDKEILVVMSLLILGGGLVSGLLDGDQDLLPYFVVVAALLLAAHLWGKRSLRKELIEAEIKEHQEDAADKKRRAKSLEDRETFESRGRP